MMDEEMKRTMQFILEQQAQFAANQQRHEEYLQRHEEHLQKHEENMRRIEELQLVTSQAIAQLGNTMIELTEAQARTDARVDTFDRKMEQLSERMAETDEHLNNLILVVERYISGRANGNA
jgi:chromosome segregation ATPase